MNKSSKIRSFINLSLWVCLCLYINSCSTSKSIYLENQPLVDIPIKATLMDIDELGYLYVLDKYNTLYKYNQEGEILYQYSSNLLGDIKKIDATNPHKILIFFPDFQQVKILDNTLSVITTFDLSQISVSIQSIALSNDNNIWIYDQTDSRIKKTNQTGEVLLSSQPLSDIVNNVFNVQFLKQEDNNVFCYDPNHGMLSFDLSINYKNNNQLLSLDITDINDSKIISIEDKAIKLLSYHHPISISENQKEELINLDFQAIVVRKRFNKWFFLTPNGIVIRNQSELK